ncbi:MAG: 8-oxo-dGTP diphosphatase [Candidatus Hydrogenedentes bacterium]|nr:8-oxo-dGTP diphosphatase [Candidatus Hydrogenedentota bacterium]
MTYTPILGTLGYIMSPDGRSTLMVHRNKRLDDNHYGKFNGLGGKMELGEDVISCIRREIREEAGIECESLVLRGTINWPGFGKGGEDWFGFIFRIDRFSGTPHTENHEGTLEWVPVDRILELPLWEGDRHFIPLVFNDDLPPFHGVMPYLDGHPVSWSYQIIG